MRHHLGVCCLVLALALPGAAAQGQADLHRYWDERCGHCHGHAADFARDSLRVVDGRLIGRRHQDLAGFLDRHQGGVPQAERGRVLAMLHAQAGERSLFRDRCADCHGSAAELGRRELIAREGALYGRYSGRRIADFLTMHGSLAPAERAHMLEVLTRVEREVHGP